MTEEEIKAMKEENERLKTQITEKDERITTLEEISRTQSTNFKKLKDMTQKEKEALSEAELENRKLFEQQQEELENLKKALGEKTEKDKQEKIDKFVNTYAGTDEAKKAKIREQYARLTDPEDSEEQIAKKVTDAVRLAGLPVGSPEGVITAHNGGAGKPADTTTEDGFSKTEEGKTMANMLGIVVEPPAKS